jgi:hypothetical protein
VKTPELESVEAFVEFLLDGGRDSFTYVEAEGLATDLGQTTAAYVIRGLKGYGLTMVTREPERRVRGINSPQHDRWYGKGSCKTHGGSGWEQVTGFAGQEG